MILFRPPCTSPQRVAKRVQPLSLRLSASGTAAARRFSFYQVQRDTPFSSLMSCPDAHELRRKRENAFRKRGRVATNERSGSLCVSPSTVHHYKAVSTQTRRLTVHLSNTHFSSHTPPLPPRHPPRPPNRRQPPMAMPLGLGPRASRSQRHLPRASGSASLLTPHLGPRPLATSRTSLPHLSSARRSRPARCASTTPTPSRGWVGTCATTSRTAAGAAVSWTGGWTRHPHPPA